jgi:hypothetical protein
MLRRILIIVLATGACACGADDNAGSLWQPPPPGPDAAYTDTGAGGRDARAGDAAADAAPDDGGSTDGASPESATDASPVPAGFVHAQGPMLLDPGGKHLIFRTAALGNWLLNEGYMWNFSSNRGDRSRRIEARISEMIGDTAAATFWKGYRDNYITETDFARIAALGFNSVRLAMNARLLLPEGQDQFDETEFAYLKNVALWGAKHRVYVILDMHGAPGGQTGTNIDDDINDSPDLFTTTTNQDRLVKLWTEIARRFADDPTVAGYDLLNEPLPSQFSQYWPQLYPLYQRVGQSIRTVDTHHMLIVEGANWADEWSTLDLPFDDNMAYSFHKYWDATDMGSIQGYIDHRTMWQRPIWCGEIGENSDDWYRAAFQLLEDNDIGWSFWTWKKMDSGNNPYSVSSPNGWSDIQNYVDNGGTPPPAANVIATLNAFITNMQFSNCSYNQDVVCSITPVLSQDPGCAGD